MVRTPRSHWRGPGFSQGTKIPQAMQRSQKKKKVLLAGTCMCSSSFELTCQIQCELSVFLAVFLPFVTLSKQLIDII